MLIYNELGSMHGEKLQLQTILKHVVMQDALLKSTRFMYKVFKLLSSSVESFEIGLFFIITLHLFSLKFLKLCLYESIN